MNITEQWFRKLYADFNARNIPALISNMTRDVEWANGMEGGCVYGHDGVEQYWKRQFTMVSSNVIPLDIKTDGDEAKIKVHQVVHDLDGNLLSDAIVYHFFVIHDHKIAKFDIEEG